MVYLTRRERFCAAHKLWIEDWTEEKNLEIFGKCANPNWHGHNYELFVTVKGEVNTETGFVIDLRNLRDLIREKVIKKLDHKNVNLDTDFMQRKMSTTENIAIGIWEQLGDEIKILGAELHCVKVQETENNSAAYYGK
ncbi:MAG: 6-pyruvoyl tetrahydrobiopterin synthase [Flavobacteriales bacterium]|nr:MAG: 6-pyruvoyl tetrahydrobiopterin synthase [Flavobacteriales bacterium]